MSLNTTALILEMNGETFFRGNSTLRAGNDVGLTGQVPTPDGGGTNQGDFWATPVNNHGVVTGIWFQPYNINSGLPAKPKPYSVAATKIRFDGVNTNGKPDYWFVLGTSTQWAAGTLPDASSLTYWPASKGAVPVVNSSGIIVSGQFKFELGVPSLLLNGSPAWVFYPVGYLNDVALPASSGAGYANTTLLLAFLNANWTNVGSPSLSIVWSLSPNGSSIQGVFTNNAADQLSVPDNEILDAFIFAVQ